MSLTLPNRPLLAAGEREAEWGPELIRPWIPMPSWDPETEITASCCDFFETTDYPPRPSSGVWRDALTLSRSSSLSPWVARPWGLLLLRLPPVDGGQDGRGTFNGTAFWRRMWCGSGRRELPSATSRLGAATDERVEQQLPAKAGHVGLPHSAPVQPGTAGPCYRLHRRRGQSGIQEIWGTVLCRHPHVNQTQPEVALLDHKCGHRTTQRPCHNLRRSWREVRCSTELFQNFRIVTTPMHVPQYF